MANPPGLKSMKPGEVLWEQTFKDSWSEAAIKCYRTDRKTFEILFVINGKSIVLTIAEAKAFYSMLVKTQVARND